MNGVRITSISCKSTNNLRPRKDFPCKNCGSNANGACSSCGILCKKCICTYFIDGEAINKEEEERKLLARRKEQRELKKKKRASKKRKRKDDDDGGSDGGSSGWLGWFKK